MVRLKASDFVYNDTQYKSFNSIVVRLKARAGDISTWWKRRFNSIVVRLKEGRWIWWVPVDGSFQFHSGSIKSSSQRQSTRSLALFQFHSGSIKSVSFPILSSRHGLFQFHSGSIKRAGHTRRDAAGRGFNSIVVRLKVSTSGFFARARPKFQFHSGSIKRTNYCDVAYSVYRFQFHSGSIKRVGCWGMSVFMGIVSIP